MTEQQADKIIELLESIKVNTGHSSTQDCFDYYIGQGHEARVGSIAYKLEEMNKELYRIENKIPIQL